MSKDIQVLVADDHQLFLEGISILLAEKYAIVGLCSSKIEVEQCLKSKSVDVILLDIDFGKTDGIEFCSKLIEKNRDLKILALTMHSEGVYVKKMIDAGAKGYILKEASMEELCHAIDLVASGNTYFSTKASLNMAQSMASSSKQTNTIQIKISKREKEVLQMILKEHTTSEIAKKLFISKHTIETHRSNLIAKLGVRNVAGLVKKTLELGLLEE